MSMAEDPWGGLNPLGCCRDHRTKGGVLTHGGPNCLWPGTTQPDARLTRKDELAQEITNSPGRRYEQLSNTSKRAVNRIVELEETLASRK